MAENWYIILELEFDPSPIQEQAVIEQRIDEKAKFWSSKFNDFNRGAEYRRYHQLVPEIRKAMSDPAERQRLAKEACEITYGPLDDLIKKIGRRGEISATELQKIADKHGVDIAVVERRRAALGIKKGEGREADYQAIYDQYYQSKPANVSTFEGIKPLLKSFGADNLYDFLFANTPINNANLLPCETLRQKAGERKKKEFYKNDSVSGSGSKLCTQCELTFKDDSSKSHYDHYLSYLRRKAILDEARGIAEISGELPAEQGGVFIDQLAEVLKDRKIASDVLTAFCIIEKISYRAKEAGSAAKKLIVCRLCGCTNDVSDGRAVCQHCGEELYIKCPNLGCGLTQAAHVKVCRCGFKFENMGKAVALGNLAERAIETLDFGAAEAYLAEAERYWPQNSKAEALRAQLAVYQQRAGTTADSMREAVAERRYHEAKGQYAHLQKLFPAFRNEDLEQEMQAALSLAAASLEQAKAATAERGIVDFCTKAYEFCRDCPGLKELAAQYPPLPPTALSITIDGNAKANILSWERPVSEGAVSYSILRKKELAPANVHDGELLGRVSDCTFSDGHIEAATPYFYAVFSERLGIPSKLAVYPSPTINLFEITGLAITVGDSLLELAWEALPSGAVAEVSRKSGAGSEEIIATTTASSYLDSVLTNDSTYSYTVRLVYEGEGSPQATRGATITGIPTKPPKGESVKLNRIAAVNDKINILLEPPSGASGFAVLYRFDRFPADIDDAQAVRREITLKQYQHNGVLVIDELAPKNYYFSVFAAYTKGGETDYSLGVDYLFANLPKQSISYSLAVSKKVFGESAVVLEFTGEERVFALPDIEIMSASGSVPMFKAAAQPFYTVAAQTVKGSLQIKIPLPKDLPPDTHIKAFLRDETLAATYQLKLKLKSSPKIS
jgi:hypothetical protein